MNKYHVLIKNKRVLTIKRTEPESGVVAHACNPSTLGGGDRRIQVHGQPQLSLSLCLSLLSEASATS